MAGAACPPQKRLLIRTLHGRGLGLSGRGRTFPACFFRTPSPGCPCLPRSSSAIYGSRMRVRTIPAVAVLALAVLALAKTLGLAGCAASGPASAPFVEASDVPGVQSSWVEQLDTAFFGDPEFSEDGAGDSAEPPGGGRGRRARKPRAPDDAGGGSTGRSPTSGFPPGAGASEPEGALEQLSSAQLALLAAARLRDGRLDAAAVVLDAAVAGATDPERPFFQRAHADALLGLRRDREAAAIYQEILGSAQARTAVATVGVGALAAVHGNLAVAHLRLGEAQEAKRQAEIALGENPQHGEAMKTLGLLAYRAGRSDEASDWLQRALEQNPSIPEARLALAELDDAAGRHAAARKRYRDLLLRFQEARTRDPHWRWRRLFYPQDVDTEVELKRRIGAR